MTASEFRVGDRVRLTGEHWDGKYNTPEAGTVVEIKSIDELDSPWFACNGDDWFIDADGYDAELVTETEQLGVNADEVEDFSDTVKKFASGGYTTPTGHPAGLVHAGCVIPMSEDLKHVGQNFATWQDILDIALLGKKLGVEKADDFVASVGEFDNPVDPDHYKFPGGVEVRQISAHLTSFGGQAVQYIARATRLDGKNKGDQVENLRKAQRMIDWEIERLEAAE